MLVLVFEDGNFSRTEPLRIVREPCIAKILVITFTTIKDIQKKKFLHVTLFCRPSNILKLHRTTKLRYLDLKTDFFTSIKALNKHEKQ